MRSQLHNDFIHLKHSKVSHLAVVKIFDYLTKRPFLPAGIPRHCLASG